MKYSSRIVVDIMIAVIISLVVNFSHLLLIFVDQDPQQSLSQRRDALNDIRFDGLFVKGNDGHGYVIFDNSDSIYFSQGRVNRYELVDGDSLDMTISFVLDGGARRYVLRNVLRRNGDVVAPYASSSPRRLSEFITQFIYYFLLAFVVIVVATARWLNRNNSNRGSIYVRLSLALLVAMLMYLFAPLVSHRNRGDLVFNLLVQGLPVGDYLTILKWTFVVVVSLLYSQIYVLLSQRQNIMLENEQLRSESLKAQYNMLMSQINPHVLFNSLNSLSMLVREKDEQRSLIYIDQLSYTFRYILQNRESTLTTLSDEMRFVEAYIYLFKIRYADKLFFDIDIDPCYNNHLIPALSLQPLLDNAVKHNTIISSRPFHVSIKVEDGVLVVSNDKYPKLESEPSTGVGLENLSRRWQLIAHTPIEVIQDSQIFVVRLPLITQSN